jgi:uncharacterized membrane protein YcaP (DUF421 family)
MGKRQIGQLQPSELVITILISEIAAIPMQNPEVPLVGSLIPVLVLVCFEIFTSALNIKSKKFRNIMQGNSLIIIRDGVLDQKQIKRLRFSVEDILEELRKKDVFDISDVLYAFAETNGSISCILKSSKQTATAEMLNIQIPDTGIPITVIDDGVIQYKQFCDCGMDINKLSSILKKNKLTKEEILLMTADKAGKINIIKKDKNI